MQRIADLVYQFMQWPQNPKHASALTPVCIAVYLLKGLLDKNTLLTRRGHVPKTSDSQRTSLVYQVRANGVRDDRGTLYIRKAGSAFLPGFLHPTHACTLATVRRPGSGFVFPKSLRGRVIISMCANRRKYVRSGGRGFFSISSSRGIDRFFGGNPDVVAYSQSAGAAASENVILARCEN